MTYRQKGFASVGVLFALDGLWGFMVGQLFTGWPELFLVFFGAGTFGVLWMMWTRRHIRRARAYAMFPGDQN